jgi:RNA polymerase sigma-70 factor (ECF subfamily)
VHDRGERIAGWVRKWNGGLTRFLERRVPARIDAQDLAQEVYLRLLRVEGFDSIAEPQAYLYRVATNVASEWRLRACNSKPHGADELESLLAEASPEAELDEMQFSAQLDAALRRLSPMVRGVLFLKLRDGLTHQEIAEQMGITPRVVRRCVSRGYLELREYLTTDRTTL